MAGLSILLAPCFNIKKSVAEFSVAEVPKMLTYEKSSSRCSRGKPTCAVKKKNLNPRECRIRTMKNVAKTSSPRILSMNLWREGASKIYKSGGQSGHPKNIPFQPVSSHHRFPQMLQIGFRLSIEMVEPLYGEPQGKCLHFSVFLRNRFRLLKKANRRMRSKLLFGA